MDETNEAPPSEDEIGAGDIGGPAGDPESRDPAERDDADTTDNATIGSRLREARQAAGLSLADVAERTKVRPGILKDLEEDAHDRLPALTYTIGFIKAYAGTVGLDPVAAAESYRQESQKIDPLPTIVDLQPLERRRLPSARLVGLTTLVLVLLIGGFWLWGSGLLTPAPPQLATTGDMVATSSDAVVTADSEAEEPEPAPVTGQTAVTLQATDEVWLRVADDTEVLFTGILQKGQNLELPPDRAWKLRTGRAGAIQATVGDHVLPALGAPAEQLRDLSLAPQDLLAANAG